LGSRVRVEVREYCPLSTNWAQHAPLHCAKIGKVRLCFFVSFLYFFSPEVRRSGVIVKEMGMFLDEDMVGEECTR
jgi:hypothetical protein